MKWRPISELPPYDDRPGRQFIIVAGYKHHSGANWARTWCDVAFIRKAGDPDCVLGYRSADMARIFKDGDMDPHSAFVTHWMPACFPRIEEVK